MVSEKTLTAEAAYIQLRKSIEDAHSRLNQRDESRIPVLTGPTASGKTALSLRLAREFRERGIPVELVNADSLIVYRGLDIGTAKPTTAERSEIRHHLIDILDPSEQYTAAEYRRAVLSAIDEILGRGAIPLIVGGSGFYLKVLFKGIWNAPPANPEFRAQLAETSLESLYARLHSVDPKWAVKIGPFDRYRLIRALEIYETTGTAPSQLEEELRSHTPPSPLELFVLDLSNDDLRERVALRTQNMIRSGLVEETQGLLAQFGPVRPLLSVGYRQVIDYLESKAPEGRKLRPGLDGLGDEIELATRQLIKQQRTWFRGLLGDPG